MPRDGKFVRITLVVAVAAAVAALAVATAGTASAKSTSANVNGAGSTFVAPLVSKWQGPVQQQLGLQLNYSPVGSGGGVSAITNKQVDFGASDAPLSQFNPTCSSCVQIPWALAATGVMYNLPGYPNLNMSGSVLAQIYMGKITKWNAKAIKKLNPKRNNLPSTSITVVHRSDSSGTTFNFTDYLSHTSHAWKSQVGTGTAVDWPTGEGEKGSSGVSGAVRTTTGAIGYADVYYAVHNHFGLFKMKNRSGNFVRAEGEGDPLGCRTRHAPRQGRLALDRQSAQEQEVLECLPDLHLHVRGRAEAIGERRQHQEAHQLGDHEGTEVRPGDHVRAASAGGQGFRQEADQEDPLVVGENRERS